jgi:hypothetical protein
MRSWKRCILIGPQNIVNLTSTDVVRDWRNWAIHPSG